MSRLTIVKNAFANLCRGGATALVSLLLPPFLTRILSKDAYGTWLLILQLATYVNLLDFGIQTAVGRYVAYCNELGDSQKRDSIVSTSLAILIGAGILAIVGISFFAWQLPNLFKDMPVELHQDARLALILVGGSLALTLPFNIFGAVFIGLQRYEVPAIIVGSSRLIGGVFVVVIAHSSHSIVMMAIVMSLSNVANGLWQCFAYKTMPSVNIKLSSRTVSIASAIEIANYCSVLLLWSMGMVLVSGLDVAIIGYFDYNSVIYYTLASSITNFLIGIQGSIFSTILPRAASLHAKGDRKSLGNLLISSTRYATIILVITSLPLLLGGQGLLNLWVGTDYANNTISLLQLLVIANFIRQLGAPYATIAMACAEQKRIILSPIIEGVVNLSVSVLLVSQFGSVGVALGTVIGSLISVVFHLCYNLPHTKNVEIKKMHHLSISIFKPLICIFPVLITTAITKYHFPDTTKPHHLSSALFLAGYIFTIVLLYRIAISEREKKELTSFVGLKIGIFSRSD
jgi:O-antigen/teichoic acid export membrane protein